MLEKRTNLEIFNETANKTLLAGEKDELFIDLDKNSNIVEGLTTIGPTSKDDTNQHSRCETIYDNKDTPASEDIEAVTDTKCQSTTMAVTQLNEAKNQEIALGKPINSKKLEDTDFDHLDNNEKHFDRRMLKLIEDKLQATRSATSFSK